MKTKEKINIKRYVEEDESYWKKHLAALAPSGLTRANYCNKHHVNYHRFGYWKKKLLDSQSQAIKNEIPVKISSLVPIAIKADESVPGTGLCSLHFKNGSVLQIHDERVLSLLFAKVV